MKLKIPQIGEIWYDKLDGFLNIKEFRYNYIYLGNFAALKFKDIYIYIYIYTVMRDFQFKKVSK